MKSSLAIMLLAVIVFLGTRIVPVHGTFIGGDDVANLFYWVQSFIKEQCFSGSLPLWNPYYYSGHPFMALPSTAFFYPGTLLFLLLPLPWAFNLDIVLHLFIAGSGVFFLVNLLTDSKRAAVAAAVVFMFNGYFMDRLVAGHLTQIHTAALIPWVFYFVERTLQTQSLRHVLFGGIAFALQILAGEPQNTFYTALFVAVYSVIRLLSLHKARDFRTFPMIGKLLIVPTVAAGIAAIQLVPTIEFAALSDRTARSYEFATFYSFPPINFLTFLMPQPMSPAIELDWEFGGYVGILALFLSAIGVLRSPKRGHTIAFLLLLIGAAVFMLGGNTPIYKMLYHVVPGIAVFRVPARCMVIVVLALSVLSGLGVHALMQQELLLEPFRGRTRGARPSEGEGGCSKDSEGGVTRRRFPVSLLAVFAVAVVMALVLITAWTLSIPIVSRTTMAPMLMAILAGLALVFASGPASRSFKSLAICCVLFVDLFFNYHSRIPRLSEKDLSTRRPYERIFAGDTGMFRVLLPFDINRGLKHQYSNVNAYTPMVLGRYFNFIYDMAQVEKPVKVRHKFDIGYFNPSAILSSKILGIKYAVILFSDLSIRTAIDGNYMPRAVLVGKTASIPSYRDQIRYMRNPEFDPRKEVVLEAEASTLPWQPMTAAGIVRITRHEANRIELKTESTESAYLVLSELYYPGWVARIDGRRASILRADCILRAIRVQPGSHTITFKYRPWSLIIGTLISGITVLILAGTALRAVRRRRTA